ncbi:type II toxin-antitoxin system VapC family toxin [Cryobacterium sp. Hh7]|uniref:type II toxin-antitoxin system VapC family toxin n=1 Tax=Cryobacterium sp. Hh7 TaxID=1259159 RepID=UPI00106CAE49|nr:type II toxin-antitoxin system VapC family toxin [Cryobacterium sp. Hh7]TFD51063.1 type II toxin-antitoxin system VapC family toxin [Cryobacterium sp. Hh7]
MIVLDTNVVSEPLRSSPHPVVLACLDRVSVDVALTSVSVGEILTGVRFLPDGHRRDDLMAAIERTLASYSDQVLPYDETAARFYALMQESRRASGHPLSVEDGMIAAICRSKGVTLATKNIKDFQDLGIDLITPWTDSPR